MYKLKRNFIAAIACTTFFTIHAQIINPNQLLGSTKVYVPAVAFLTITPDARAAGMGDCGVATSYDMNSMHYNPAKYAFAERNTGVGISYTPWMRELVPDLSLSYFSLYHRIDSKSVIAASVRYFSLGTIQFTGAFGASLGNQNPRELAVDATYARKLGNNFSVGVALRYIHSNLVPNLAAAGGIPVSAGVSGAGDVSAYYKNDIKISNHKTTYSFGANFQNMGSKITYTNSQNKYFIPATFRVGSSIGIALDEKNSLMITSEITKLLVPLAANNNDGAFGGMAHSFYDSPGGFNGELKEFNWSAGVEYSFSELLKARAGYFHESLAIGDRKYFTFGMGVNFNSFGLDVAYLYTSNGESPLRDTFHFSLTFLFDNFVTKVRKH